MKGITRVVPLMALIGLIAACGSSSSSDSATESTESSDTPAITDISELPNATSPMAAASANLAKGVSKAALTGANLLSTTTSNIDPTDSMAACEMFNVVKDSIVSASQADQILCYVKTMNTAFSAITDANAIPINVYDGRPHIFNMNITGAPEGSPSKVKMQIAKDAVTGNITSFKMFMCKDHGGTNVQNEYTDEAVVTTTTTNEDGTTESTTTFSMTALGNFADAEWSGSHYVYVEGDLDAAGAFTEKTITMKNTGGSTGDITNTNWQEATLVQIPGGFTLNGYQKGNHNEGGNTGSYSQAAYGIGEMLGDTSAVITNLAMGDGAVNVNSAYAWDSQQWGSDTFSSADIFAWSGDTLAAVDPASGSSFYTAAAAGTVPTPAASVDIDFTAAQTWDCSDDEAVAVDLPAIDETAMQTACSQYGSMNHSWINCYSAIHQQQP